MRRRGVRFSPDEALRASAAGYAGVMQRQLRSHAGHVVLRTHHEFRRTRKHLEMDAEADVAYGDGTAEWLIEALQYVPRDSSARKNDAWQAVRPSWDLH